MSLHDKIVSTWENVAKPEQRTRANFQSFYKRMLINNRVRPIQARYDEAGNCTTCDESGRCPGWHYEGQLHG